MVPASAMLASHTFNILVNGVTSLLPLDWPSGTDFGPVFNSMIREPLPINSESFVTMAVTLFILNKNLAIANRSCVSCAHSMPRASMITP